MAFRGCQVSGFGLAMSQR